MVQEQAKAYPYDIKRDEDYIVSLNRDDGAEVNLPPSMDLGLIGDS